MSNATKNTLDGISNITVKETLPAYFGEFGGMFVGELLVPALEQLEQAFIESQTDEAFLTEFNNLLTKLHSKIGFMVKFKVASGLYFKKRKKK